MNDEQTYEGAGDDIEPPSSTLSDVLRRQGGVMWQERGRAIVLTLILTLVTGVIYPLVSGGFAQILFPAQANGSILRRTDGSAIGSSLIGQQFVAPGYFHPRPSAAGVKGYDATASGASNLGPTNATLIRTVADRAAAYRQENGVAAGEPLPVDAVTASGSELDPDISPANARLQAPRVAKARGRPVSEIRALVDAHTDTRLLGFLGEPVVNVLELNLALDGTTPS